MLSVSIGILTVLVVISSVLLVLIVLMQRPKQEGLGAAFGGGMMDSVAGAHTTDVLQKGTIWLAVVFLGGSVLLAVLKAREHRDLDPGELLPSAEFDPSLPPSIGEMPFSLDDLPLPEPFDPEAPAPSLEPGAEAPAPAPESAPAAPAAPEGSSEPAPPAPGQ